MTAVLEINHLTKSYGALKAVNDLSFVLNKGDTMGFVGPNGAGKTTTIKIAASLLDPTEGSVRICGYDVTESPMEVRKVLGYMPDFFGVYDDLKVWEYLDFFAAAYRIPKADRKQAADDVLELTDLAVKRESYVESLSRGMKQRLCLAKTLLHDPQLLILDEPASGLDPRARIELKEIIRDLKSMGKTVLISSHILPELADFCNKIAVVEAGRLVVAGSVADITAATHQIKQIEILVKERQDEAVTFLSELEAVTMAETENAHIIVNYGGTAGDEHEIVSQLVHRGFQVLEFTPTKVDLEDVFMKVTRGIVQ
ncbi:MAG: ABC transporter ATP-binding protein [Armatimonadota bacterium]